MTGTEKSRNEDGDWRDASDAVEKIISMLSSVLGRQDEMSHQISMVASQIAIMATQIHALDRRLDKHQQEILELSERVSGLEARTASPTDRVNQGAPS